MAHNEIQESYKLLLEKELSNAQTEGELKVKSDWEYFSSKPSGMTDTEAEKLQDKWEDSLAMRSIARLFDKMNAEGRESALG